MLIYQIKKTKKLLEVFSKLNGFYAVFTLFGLLILAQELGGKPLWGIQMASLTMELEDDEDETEFVSPFQLKSLDIQWTHSGIRIPMPQNPAVAVGSKEAYLFGGTSLNNEPLDQLIRIGVQEGTEDRDFPTFRINMISPTIHPRAMLMSDLDLRKERMRSGSSMVKFKSHLIVIGGYGFDENFIYTTAHRKVLLFNLDTKQWSVKTVVDSNGVELKPFCLLKIKVSENENCVKIACLGGLSITDHSSDPLKRLTHITVKDVNGGDVEVTHRTLSRELSIATFFKPFASPLILNKTIWIKGKQIRGLDEELVFSTAEVDTDDMFYLVGVDQNDQTPKYKKSGTELTLQAVGISSSKLYFLMASTGHGQHYLQSAPSAAPTTEEPMEF